MCSQASLSSSQSLTSSPLSPTPSEPRGKGGEEDSDTSYFSKSEEEDSYEEGGSDGELLRKKPKYPRYDHKASLPTFSLGMGFSCKGDFIQAVRQYGLARRHVIKFCKNDNKRVRAKCEWAKCPWFILLSNNSRTEGWLVTSLKDEHTCPPRRDNKLVTSRRIAEKFESAIMGNPTWKLEHLKETVHEQMHADVSIAKCKRDVGPGFPNPESSVKTLCYSLDQ